MRKIFFVFILLIFISQAACSPQTKPQSGDPQPLIGTPEAIKTDQPPDAEGYPAAPEPTINNSEYPAPAEPTPDAMETTEKQDDHYVMTEDSAFLALPAAREEAKKWRPNAVFYHIPRLRQMEVNLAFPKGPSGWFFSFRDTDGSTVELYVEVIVQDVAGKTEVQQLYSDGKPPYKLIPIDTSTKLIEHKDAFNIFLQSTGNEYVKGKGQVEIDFELVQLEGMQNPVWSIYDIADPDAPPLANVDAVTGKLVNDPFGFLR